MKSIAISFLGRQRSTLGFIVAPYFTADIQNAGGYCSATGEIIKVRLDKSENTFALRNRCNLGPREM